MILSLNDPTKSFQRENELNILGPKLFQLSQIDEIGHKKYKIQMTWLVKYNKRMIFSLAFQGALYRS